MLLKNVASQGIFLFEYTIATGAPTTGDSANITGYWSLDGGTATVFGTTHPTELSSTHMPGVYWQPLAQGETNGNCIAYSWTGSAGTAINPVLVLTTGVSIPVVAPGAANGLFIAGTNAPTTITTSLTTHLIGTVDTVTTVTNQLTASQIATGVWQDATSGDFAATSSIGKSLYTSGNAPGAASGLLISTSLVSANMTQILGTAVSTPATSGVLDVNVKNIGGTVTAGAAGYVGVDWGHVNAPTTAVGLSGTTVGTVTTTTTATNLTNAPTAGDLTATMKASVSAAVLATPADLLATDASGRVSLNLAQTLSAFGSALTSSTADTALTVNEALHCAVASVVGQQTTVGTVFTTKTSAGTTLRAFTLDQNPNPNNRS
jgi:hypothetical protein